MRLPHFPPRTMLLLAWLWLTAHRRVSAATTLVSRVMEQQEPAQSQATPQQNGQLNGHAAPPPAPARTLFLVRHGQATFNVEGRHPGQLPGIPLTDVGRRQAQQAAVALSALPLSAVLSSPLERARETAETIARGWGVQVRTDPRLMDSDVGAWAGQKLDELAKNDPAWKAYLEHPDDPPPGVEGLSAVQRRSIAVVEEIRADESLGQYVVLVAHADVLKLILAYYLQTPVTAIRYMNVANASISALALPKEGTPDVLAVNWTALPRWLTPPPVQRAESPANVLSPETGRAAEVGTTGDGAVWP